MSRFLIPLLEGYGFARSAVYFFERFPLDVLHRLAHRERAVQVPPEFEKAVLYHAQQLIQQDAKNIAENYYPLRVLFPTKVKDHVANYLRIFADSFWLNRRRQNKSHQQFSRQSKQFLDAVPEYYRRNFHFQTDGYLSDASARLYDHQVEILFRGVADAMRRLFIRPLKERGWSTESKIKVLELGAGTGAATRPFIDSFPQADVTCLDLSYPYLKEAQRRLRHYPRLSFLQGDAAHTRLVDHSFDGVFSVFLFHELPFEEREMVVKEAIRILKPGGFFAFVDSLQKNDVPELNFGLEQFPIDFHEPFYKNYTEHNMTNLLVRAGFTKVAEGFGFFSKWIVAEKPNDGV